jgi:hypothetical protein
MKGIVSRQALAVEDDAAGRLEADRAVGDVEVLNLLLGQLDAEEAPAVLDDIGILRVHADRDLCLHVEVNIVLDRVHGVVEVSVDRALAGHTVPFSVVR